MDAYTKPKRIIPCLDINKGRVVKGIKFVDLKDAGDPVEIAKAYNDTGADEVVFLDITATLEERKTIIDVVEKVASRISIPLTVGGGIKKLTDIEEILKAGANKVSLNTAAVLNSDLINKSAVKFGSDRIVVAIDAKLRANEKGWDVYIKGGSENAGKDVVDWAEEAERRGAGELLVTSIDTDGTRRGYDVALIKAVAEAVTIPVIASGGAGKLEHFYEVLTYGKADAALAASLFHYGELTVMQVKNYLKNMGVPVRTQL